MVTDSHQWPLYTTYVIITVGHLVHYCGNYSQLDSSHSQSYQTLRLFKASATSLPACCNRYLAQMKCKLVIMIQLAIAK